MNTFAAVFCIWMERLVLIARHMARLEYHRVWFSSRNARPLRGPGSISCADRVYASAHSGDDPIAQDIKCSSPGTLGKGARLRRPLSLPRSRVPLLNRSRRCTRLACRLRRRYAHAPRVPFQRSVRVRARCQSVRQGQPCVSCTLLYVFVKAKRTSGRGSDFASSIQP